MVLLHVAILAATILLVSDAWKHGMHVAVQSVQNSFYALKTLEGEIVLGNSSTEPPVQTPDAKIASNSNSTEPPVSDIAAIPLNGESYPKASESSSNESSQSWSSEGHSRHSYHHHHRHHRGDAPASKEKIIHNWKLEKIVGKGAEGIVYKGSHASEGTPVAIKVMKDKLHEEMEVEIAIQKLLTSRNCPNIVRVLDDFMYRGSRYLVMPFGGKDLDEALKEHEKFDEEEAWNIFSQVLWGVHHMHLEGVIHRDLKPPNILYDDEKYIRIADFGHALWVGSSPEEDASTHLYITNQSFGTPEYSPPEAYKIGFWGAASDAFSIGIILHQLLTGDIPFKEQEFEMSRPSIFIDESLKPDAQEFVRHLIELDYPLVDASRRKRMDVRHVWTQPWMRRMKQEYGGLFPWDIDEATKHPPFPTRKV